MSHPGRPTGSTQPLEVQARALALLAEGRTINAVARELGVSHDAVRVIRDGHLARRASSHDLRVQLAPDVVAAIVADLERGRSLAETARMNATTISRVRTIRKRLEANR